MESFLSSASHSVSSQQGMKWLPLLSYVPGAIMVSGVLIRVLQSCPLMAHNKLRGRAASVGNGGTVELRIGRLSQDHGDLGSSASSREYVIHAP